MASRSSRRLAIAGAVAALTISFTVLALAWRQPRFDKAPGRPAPGWLSRLVEAPTFRIGRGCVPSGRFSIFAALRSAKKKYC